VGVLPNAPFTGIVSGSLDKKGRVCIPAQFRHILAAQSPHSVYIRKALLTASLEAFGASVMQRFHDAQSESDPFFMGSHDAAAFALLALSQELAVDDTGRVRIPDEFIAHAGLTEDVTFVGIGRRFEIWDTEGFAPVLRERLEAATEQQKRQAEKL
jgi:MraZ protein